MFFVTGVVKRKLLTIAQIAHVTMILLFAKDQPVQFWTAARSSKYQYQEAVARNAYGQSKRVDLLVPIEENCTRQEQYYFYNNILQLICSIKIMYS